MADATPQKRVLPARERRESAAKRRASSPFPRPKPMVPTPKRAALRKSTPKSTPGTKYSTRRSVAESTPSRRISTPIVVGERLPTKLGNAKLLPTSRIPQPQQLSLEDYQTIAESAVLAASLIRSRTQWLCDGVFERYWVKPLKRKGAPEVGVNNPDVKSMSKLGTCTVAIEPHVFEAMVYIVRDPQGPAPMHFRHPNQYPQHPPLPQHFQNYYPGPHQYASPQNIQGRPPQPPLPVSHQLALPDQPAIKQENVNVTANTATSASKNGQGADDLIPAGVSTPSQAPNALSHDPTEPATRPAQPAPTPAKPTADPVIQMLATRAASDPDLKALMKIVASSKATQDQLKLFQSHIDELNNIIKRQEAEKVQREQQQQQQQREHRKVSMPDATCSLPQLDGTSENSTPSRTGTPTQPIHTPIGPLYASHPQQYNQTPASSTTQPPAAQARNGPGKSGPLPLSFHPPPYAAYPTPRQEPRIKHIVLEFTCPNSSSDRWLFPEYAVLDTPPTGCGLEMICSFFVIRKGSEIVAAQGGTVAGSSEKWKANEDYYQAVNMTLTAPIHRTLETIARAAKPLTEVQNYMKEVIETKKRAPLEYLVTRLPRERSKAVDVDVEMLDAGLGGEFVDSAVEVGSGDEDDELKDYYGT